MRKIIIIVSLAIVVASYANKANADSYELAKNLLVSSKSDSRYMTYLVEFINSQNEQRLDDDSGCYQIEKGSVVELILTVNEAGVISAVDASTDTNKANCFKRAYIGAKMPKPPFFPIAISLTMN